MTCAESWGSMKRIGSFPKKIRETRYGELAGPSCYPVTMEVLAEPDAYVFTQMDPPGMYFAYIAAKNAGEAGRFLVRYQLLDRRRKTVLAEGGQEVEIARGGVALFPAEIGEISRRFGNFMLRLEAVQADQRLGYTEVRLSRIWTRDYTQDSPIGCCDHMCYEQIYADKKMKLAAMAGIRWVRDDSEWSLAEQRPGEIVMPDGFLYRQSAIDRHGLKLLMILNDHDGCCKEFYWKNDPEIGNPASLEAFARYCRECCRCFGDRVTHFEVWNEFNFIDGRGRTPELYASLVKTAYTAVKDVNPSVRIVAGVTCNFQPDWIRRMLAAGAYDYLDVLSIHPYSLHPEPTGPEYGGFLQKLEVYRDLMKPYGEPKPIWVTEFGWGTYDGSAGIDQDRAAAYAVRTYALGWASGLAEKIFWYDLKDDGFDRYDVEQNFGLLGPIVGNPPLAPKSAYVAVAAFAYRTDGAQFRRELGGDGWKGLLWTERDGGDCLMLWTHDAVKPMRLQTAADKLTVYDMHGNPCVYDTEGDGLYLAAGAEPIYIQAPCLEDVRVDAFVPAPWLAEGTPVLTLARGEEGSAVLDLEDGYAVRPLEGADFPFVIEGNILRVWPGKHLTEGDYPLPLSVWQGERCRGWGVCLVRITDPYRLYLHPVTKDGVHWRPALTIRNLTAAPHRCTVACSGKEASYTLPPGGQERLEWDEDRLDSPFELTGTVGWDGRERPLEGYVNGLLVPKAGKAPDFSAWDGGFWENAVRVHLDETHYQPGIDGVPYTGITADLYLQWDEENLYVGAQVQDAVHCQTGLCGDVFRDLWDGDGLEIVLSPDTDEGMDAGRYNHFVLALSSVTNRPVTWRWRKPVNQPLGEMPDCRLQVSRDGDCTGYQAALPWNSLLPAGMRAAANATFGFALNVNDNNGRGNNDGRLRYNRGIGTWYDAGGFDPKLFGSLLLRE